MIPHKNIPKDIGRLLFWFPFRLVIQMVSFRAVYVLGGWMGLLDYYLTGSKAVSRMKRNLKETFGYSDATAISVIKRHYQHHSRHVMELIKYPQVTQETLSKLITIEGLCHLNRAMEKNKGAILLTGHYGAKQAIQLGLGLQGYPLIQVHYHRTREELTWIQKNVSQKYRKKIEQAMPVSFVSSRGFLGSVVKALKKNKVLLISGDGIGMAEYMGKGYAPFDFLGRKMMFPTGSAVLAEWTRAEILPVFAVKEGFRHRIVIYPPIDAKLSKGDMVRQYIRVAETHIRKDPSLWEFWEEFDSRILLAPEKAPEKKLEKAQEKKLVRPAGDAG